MAWARVLPEGRNRIDVSGRFELLFACGSQLHRENTSPQHRHRKNSRPGAGEIKSAYESAVSVQWGRQNKWDVTHMHAYPQACINVMAESHRRITTSS